MIIEVKQNIENARNGLTTSLLLSQKAKQNVVKQQAKFAKQTGGKMSRKNIMVKLLETATL